MICLVMVVQTLYAYDDRTMIASQKHRLFLVGSDVVFGQKIGSDDRTIGEKIVSNLPILKSCDSRALV